MSIVAAILMEINVLPQHNVLSIPHGHHDILSGIRGPISGAKQKGYIFKSTIKSVCKSIFLEQQGKESCNANCPLYLCEMDGVEPVPYSGSIGLLKFFC